MSQKTGEQPRQNDFFYICASCPTGCCRGVKPPLTSRRMTIIQNYLNANGVGIMNPFEKTTYSFPREVDGDYCVFWNRRTKRCAVHQVKPETCVAGPVTFDINTKTGKIEWFLKMEKICRLAGALYRDKKALNSHLESARTELLSLVHDLYDEDLRAIMKVEEPDTFKIDEEDVDADVLKKLEPCA
jgi:Fe-S-cluster containining protein